MGSPAYSFKGIDWLSIVRGAGIAATGAALTYLEQEGMTFDQKTAAGAVAFVLLSTLVNLARKWLFSSP